MKDYRADQASLSGQSETVQEKKLKRQKNKAKQHWKIDIPENVKGVDTQLSLMFNHIMNPDGHPDPRIDPNPLPSKHVDRNRR